VTSKLVMFGTRPESDTALASPTGVVFSALLELRNIAKERGTCCPFSFSPV